jgi:hypothetical protein
MDAGAEDVQRVEGEDDATEGYKARSLEAFLRLVCGIACCPVPWMQADVRSMSNFDVAACSCGLFRDSCSASQGDTRREGSWCFTHWWLLSVVAVSAMPWCSGADKRRRVRIGTRQPASARHPGSRRPVRAGVLAPHCHRGALTSSFLLRAWASGALSATRQCVCGASCVPSASTHVQSAAAGPDQMRVVTCESAQRNLSCLSTVTAGLAGLPMHHRHRASLSPHRWMTGHLRRTRRCWSGCWRWTTWMLCTQTARACHDPVAGPDLVSVQSATRSEIRHVLGTPRPMLQVRLTMFCRLAPQ